MSKINLTSQKWNDIVFEQRNKGYGAYDMRINSNRRHIVALIVIILLALLAFFLPRLIRSVIPKQEVEEETGMVNITNVTLDAPAVEDIPPPVYVPPIEKQPEVMASMKSTAVVIVPKDSVRNEVRTQEELNQTDKQIATTDNKGSDNPDAVHPDSLLNIIPDPTPTPTKIFERVEQMPMFPGGNAALTKHINDNVVYPRVALETEVQGTVNVRFVVEPSGEITNVKVLKPVDPHLDAAAIKYVSGMPKWIPGKQNGVPVRVYAMIPVRFRISQ